MTSISSTNFTLSSFPPGTHTWTHLHFGAPMRVPVTVPLAVARGVSDGPTCLVTALVHGDEFEGPAAIADCFNTRDGSNLSGTFMGLPVTNPWAYAGQSRNTPDHYDGLNLARQFPGDVTGSRTQQHAALLYNWVTETLTSEDVFIDLHSAGSQYEYASMVGYHPTGDESESRSLVLAQTFGIDNIWRIPESPSSTRTFNSTVARTGIPTVGTEVRGCGALRASDVADLVTGLRNVMAHQSMLPDSAPGEKPRPVHTTHQTSFASSGLFRTNVDLEASVSAGQTLGHVYSLKGELVETVTAPIGGVIWAIRRFASVRTDDLAFLVATQQSN